MVTAVPVEGLTEPVVEMVVSPAVDVAIGVVCASLIVVCARADAPIASAASGAAATAVKSDLRMNRRLPGGQPIACLTRWGGSQQA